MNIMIEYITAKDKVSQKIEYRKGTCQNPDFEDKISQTNPIRYTRLTKIKRTPPKNFARMILLRETGFESNISMFPFSSIEGMNDDTDIKQKVIMSRYEMFIIATSNPITRFLMPSSPEVSIRFTMPSIESTFIKKRNTRIINVEIAKNPINIFFAIASLKVLNIRVVNIISVLTPD